MGRKVSKLEVIQRIWGKICYTGSILNCLSCTHSDKNKWFKDSDDGECNLLTSLTFPISKGGICKHHSNFSNKNLKRNNV